MYWFPHTDVVRVKRNSRTVDDPEPVPAARRWLEDRFLANTVYGRLVRLGELAPPLVPSLNRLAVAAWGTRRFSDASHRVFVSPRQVVFKEMEYAVPREAGMAALAEVRRVIEANRWRVGFPVEVRSAPSDEAWLSTSYARDTVHLAFHVPARTDHRGYFRTVEQVLWAHGGRPHWGKLHSRTAAQLAGRYPRWEDFARVRDRVDPDRRFANPYLDRVLGP
jgi:FAD/FMN-containing dehydrogenase